MHRHGIWERLRELYANLFGYFWLPCPVCKRMFGGHEASFGAVRVGDRRMCVCASRRCQQEAASQEWLPWDKMKDYGEKAS